MQDANKKNEKLSDKKMEGSRLKRPTSMRKLQPPTVESPPKEEVTFKPKINKNTKKILENRNKRLEETVLLENQNVSMNEHATRDPKFTVSNPLLGAKLNQGGRNASASGR